MPASEALLSLCDHYCDWQSPSTATSIQQHATAVKAAGSSGHQLDAVTINLDGGVASLRVEGYANPMPLYVGVAEAAAILYASGMEFRRPSTVFSWHKSLKVTSDLFCSPVDMQVVSTAIFRQSEFSKCLKRCQLVVVAWMSLVWHISDMDIHAVGLGYHRLGPQMAALKNISDGMPDIPQSAKDWLR